MPDLRTWLASLHLDGHYETFVENKIDADVLLDLSERDLEKLHIPLGDRKRLMKAIQALSDERSELGQSGPRAGEPLGPGMTLRSLPNFGPGKRLRHLTTVFVDLVGSTALSEQLDLEDYWKVITSYQLCCTECIQNYHGFVARYLGDGVLAYFGYPRAAEDDAERAVAAGLAVVQAVGTIENLRGVNLEARVGIATGNVLISDLANGVTDSRDTVLGDTPNLAARLQTVAKPGTVVISESTRILLGNQIKCSNIGSLSLKGFSEAMSVWEVREIQHSPSRFEARRKGRMTPLSGRHEELAMLVKRWRAVVNGEGRVALISGEAGIGKSRLVESLYEQIKAEPHIRHRYQCSPFHTGSALYPFITQIAHALENGRDEPHEDKLDRLEALLGRAVDDVSAVAPLFARLLSIPTNGRYRPLDQPAGSIREATKQALVDQYLGLAKQKPVVLVIEDIHWIDPTTEEFLGALIERITFERVLLVCTYRSGYESVWSGRAGVSSLHLSRLDHRQSLEMIRQLCNDQALSPGIMEAIADKAEGVPLFIEELTRTVLDSSGEKSAKGEESLDQDAALALPSTLNELLMAKLDSLAGTGEVVTICAAIGRSFPQKLVARVSGLSDEELRAILERLMREQILTRRGQGPDPIYSFRHALIQEAAYSTMLKSRITALHARVAKNLVEGMPDYAARSPEVVAYHYNRAAMPKQARDFWASAADLAIERSAYLEAIAHLEAALDENAALEEERDRFAAEIALREKLIIPLEARFWGSDDIASNFNRLHELQAEYGSDKDLFAALDGLYGTHIIGGKPDLALDYALKMKRIAETQDDATFAMMSQHAIGMCYFGKGDFDAAIAHFSEAMGLRPRASVEIMSQYYLADVEIIDQCMQSWAYVLSGDGEAAETAIGRARALTEATDHEFSRAYGFSILASAHQGRGEAEICLDYASRALQLSQGRDFRYWEAWAQIMHGWATAATGSLEQGVEELTAGLDAYVGTGSGQIVLYAKTLLADAHLRAGRTMSGLTLIEEIEAAEQAGAVRFQRPIAERVARDLRAAVEGEEGGAGR